ncbi:MAG: sigma-54-dependent Fis family transcriptional regulator [Candidatus Marinimicrobia bacterium]|nr:sigma-54-dependent Fis family transcriptional regulator [Candidatus Neomarinimicrobiota bacterium]
MRIAIIDDDSTILEWFVTLLKQDGHELFTAGDGEAGVEAIIEHQPDVALVDLKMPGIDGLEVTRQVLKENPSTIIILMTAHATISTAVEAMKLGASEYLSKPLDIDEVRIVLHKAEEKIALLRENRTLKKQIEQIGRSEVFETKDPNLTKILREAGNAAKTDTPILITGENGTGKEVFAKYIFKLSNRANKQFVVVNCAALSEQLLESELFGHAKGAFTGAIVDHAGYFEIADGGTIFLDETGELSPAMQVRLLRVLQSGEYSRVGETKTRKTDVRVLAATNRDLHQLIEEEKFREDFYYRINVFEFKLPPLRERREDIMPYFEMFIKEFCLQMNKKEPEIDKGVEEILLGYRWPGNIRELKNVAERTSILYDPEVGKITRDLIPDRLMWSAPVTGDDEELKDYKAVKENVVREFERSFITRHLRKQKGNIAATAREIQVHPVFLRQKVAALGIDPKAIKN